MTAIEEIATPRADHHAHLVSLSGAEALMQVMKEPSHDLVAADLIRIMEVYHAEKALVKSTAYLYGSSRKQSDGISDEYSAVQRENALANIPAAKAMVRLASESLTNAFSSVSDGRAYGKVA